MTFKECAVKAWKADPFKPLKQAVKVLLLLISVVVIVVGGFIAPMVTLEEYFKAKGMGDIFPFMVTLYWILLALIGSFVVKMVQVCKEGKS